MNASQPMWAATFPVWRARYFHGRGSFNYLNAVADFKREIRHRVFDFSKRGKGNRAWRRMLQWPACNQIRETAFRWRNVLPLP